MAKRKGRVSIAMLERALMEKKQELEELKERREQLVRELAKVDKAIAAIQGRAPRGRGGRRGPGRQPSLLTLVVQTLAQNKKPMTAGELAEAVLAAGYKTKSKNLQALIWSQIYKDDRIVKAERGKFQLKPGVKIEKS